jgi:hypothetical protein
LCHPRKTNFAVDFLATLHRITIGKPYLIEDIVRDLMAKRSAIVANLTSP